jgi:hypothetical protein
VEAKSFEIRQAEVVETPQVDQATVKRRLQEVLDPKFWHLGKPCYTNEFTN